MLSRLVLLVFVAPHAMSMAPAFTAQTTAAQVRSTFQSTLPSYLSTGAAVITGANSGLGLECAKELLQCGCKVVLCSRCVESGKAALASLEGIDASRARVQKLDLADLDSVRDAAKEILAVDPHISLLLNNAGVMATPQGQTKQGFELQFGTNHLGHHALTRLLLPGIVKDGRIVTVASTAHTMGMVDTKDLFFETRKYQPWSAYGQSKAANILFAKGLADKLAAAGSNILSVSLHPGVIGTSLWRHGNPLLTWIFHRIILDKDIPQGAATSMYAALADASRFVPGDYLADCNIAKPNEQCTDERKRGRQDLWEVSERLIAKAGLDLPDELI